ncbi:MAG TPA: hypothetical protein PLU53_09345, partial [Bacteroidia bacterium]|nr:hypothetical protein [Bacteroidia bacterium]
MIVQKTNGQKLFRNERTLPEFIRLKYIDITGSGVSLYRKLRFTHVPSRLLTMHFDSFAMTYGKQKYKIRLHRIALCALLMLRFPVSSEATHISGADITYTWVSGNTYQLSLALYRDCSGVSAPTSVSVSYSSVSCNYNLSVTLNKLAGTGQEITHPCASGLTTCSGGTSPGIQKYEYTGTVTLPAQCTDWRFGYTICCRNCAITTLSYSPPNCSGVPALYVEATLNNVAAQNNSSPIFSNIPISFLCIGQAFHYNHGAFETDGDSITYSFITPRSAANTNVTFASGYNVNNPISSSPAMTLDASGDILVTPTQSEVGVMAIIVREYRNGVLVGSVIRDMQIWTQPCSNLLPTATGINGSNNFSYTACPNVPISIYMNSGDANATQIVTMNWNNSIPGASFTTTNVQFPRGTFTWTPTVADARPQPYTFTVTVQDNNCPSAGFQTYSYDIYVSQITASAIATPSPCANPVNGTVSVTATGSAPFHYTWLPGGETSATVSGLGAGTYTVTATDANGCSATASTSVTIPPAIAVAVAGSSGVSCRGGNDGAAAVSVSGGTSPYTYAWSPGGGTSASVSNLTAGNYTVTVTDVRGCTQTTTVSILQPATLLSSVTGNTALLCNGDGTGTATVSASGGTLPYAYSWSVGGATSTSLSGLSAGNYSVTTTDAHGCTTVTSVTITQPAIINSTVNVTAATCGSANGSASISASGGTGPYSYQWSPGNSGGPAISGVGAGAYTVNITDAHGCTASNVAAISNLGGPVVSVTSVHSVMCAGGSTGDISIQVTGGQAPFSYQWSPAVSAGTFASGLQAGSYSVVVRDGNNCVSSTVVDITESNPLLINLSPTHPKCFGGTDGAIVSSVSGGATPYTYSWTGNAGAVSNPVNLAAGTYQVTLTDAYGCTATESISLVQPPQLNVNAASSSPVSCFGGNNGSASVTASGGTSPYTYSWSPASGSLPTIVALSSGTYSVTVTDAHSCTQSASVNVTQPALLLSSISSSTPVMCHGDTTGAAIVAVNGGTTPYAYQWSFTGSTGMGSGNLPAGTYSVSVTDANGCTTSSSATIAEPPALTTTILSPVNVTCNGGNNGLATVLASGGTTPYSYSWSPSGGSAAAALNLPANTYTVTVTDGNNCNQTSIASINEPPLLTISLLSSQMNACNGDASGTATTDAAGGTEPYTYQWSPSGGNSFQASQLTAGNYAVLLTDINGCTATLNTQITDPPTLSVSTSTQPATCSASNGNASVIPSGGTPPYRYLWSPGGNTTASLSSIPAGNYAVTVTDANGCTQSVSMAVSNIGGPSVSVASVSPVVCAGASTGGASVVVTGGTAPFIYQWSPAGGTSATASGLNAGTYSVIVTDGNHCISGLSVVISEPAPLNINTSSSHVLCAGAGNGSVSASVTGGVSPYTYVWNPGPSTTASLTGIPGGMYSVTVHDANGCTLSATALVTEPSPLVFNPVTINPVSCAGGSNGSATLNASGGTPAYQYVWTPAGGSSPSATGLPAGNYTVTVSDAHNCQVSVPVMITQPQPLQSNSSTTNSACHGENTGSISLNVTGGTAAYTYAWSNGAISSPALSSLIAGTYSCTITDQNGCTISITNTITEPPLLQASLASLRNVSCAGGNDGNASVSVQGGSPPYVYSWSPGNCTTATASALTTGNYSVSVTDALGCQEFVAVTISEPPLFVVQPSATAGTCGVPNGVASVNATGGTLPYSYQWTPGGSTAASLSGLPAGTYTCTSRDANGCSVVSTLNVTNSGSITATVSGINNVNCFGGNDGSVSVNVSGGTAPIVYSWSSASGNTPVAGNLTAGQYTVTVTDAFQCSHSLTAIVTEPAPLAGTIPVFNHIRCFGAQDGSAAVAVSGGTLPYTYRWSPVNDTTAQLSNLSAGNYAVAVTDAHGCTTQSQVTLTEPAQLQAQVISSPATCGSSNGDVQVTASGGMLPFSYYWTPGGATTNQLSAVQAGAYAVLVSDANNCQLTLNTFVSNIGGPSIVLANTEHVSCHGGQDGNATVSVLQGTAPFVYQWSPSGGNDSLASNLNAGSYSVIVSDANNCVTGLAVVISEPPVLQAMTIATDALCAGNADGTAGVIASGGSMPYLYTWSSGDTTASVSNLLQGNYYVQVTDANGCTVTGNTSVSQPREIISTVSLTHVNCFNGSDGAILLENTGGSPVYTYSWSNGATTNAITGIRAGNYSVTITDQHGCTGLEQVVITEPDPLVLNFTATNTHCFGTNDGSAVAQLSGGIPPYNYQWSPAGGTLDHANGLAAGSYTLIVTDDHGCTRSSAVTIGSPEAIQLTTNQQPALCAGSKDASAEV